MEGEEVWWEGESGTHYRFLVACLDTRIGLLVPGIFIIVRREKDGWLPLYCGRTSDLNERVVADVALGCLGEAGATHVHIRAAHDGEVLMNLEWNDLVPHLKPLCGERVDASSATRQSAPR
jgi:hypothetical protein